MKDIQTDILILANVTSPFLRADTVKKCIAAVKSGEYDSAVAVTKLKEFLWKDGKSFNFDSSNMPRSQDLPEIFKETCGCEVFYAKNFLETKNYVGERPFFCEVDEIEEIDIDWPLDFEIANAIYMYLLQNR